MLVLYVYKMGIKREVLWTFKISWQTWIQQEYFSGTKQMEVSFMLVVLAVKKTTVSISAIYKRKKAQRCDMFICRSTDVPKIRVYP